METTMYDMLLQLPLFQGLGKNDFTNILSKVKFHFSTYKAGEKIIAKGEPCRNLVFLLSGSMIAESDFEEEKFVFGEVLTAPYLIEPFSLFGLHQRFMSTYIAKTDVSMMTIEKEFLSTELNKYETFRINFINFLSNGTQHLYERVRRISYGNSTEKKIVDFLFLFSDLPYGEKIMRVRMEDLALLLGCTRNKISLALNNLEDKKLISLQRMGFKVPALEKLKADW